MRKYVVAAAVVLLLAGCVRTLHPLYTKKDLTFDPALVGVWEPRDPDKKERWDFRKAGEKSYKLIHTDENDRKVKLEAHLVELGEYRFLDLNTDEPEESNALQSLLLQPVHMFMKVESIEPRLKLVVMNPQWLGDHLEEHPDALKTEDPEDAPAVVTASTKDLQKFVLKHADNDKAWGKPIEFLRVKQEKQGPANIEE